MPSVPNIVLANARVFTADADNPSAQAVTVAANRIVFVGGLAQARALAGPGAREIDCGGNSLLPGFNDNHFHMLLGALESEGMQFDGLHDYQQVEQVIAAYRQAHPDLEWLVGRKLNYAVGPGHSTLQRQHLDVLAPDRPLVIQAYDGHTAWANTRALELAGILHGGEAGVNSEIVVDEHGLATGELREEAACLKVFSLVPEPDQAGRRRLLNEAFALTTRLGVTSVYNMDGDEGQASMYAAMEDRGELSVRIYVPYSAKPETTTETLRTEAAALRERYHGELVRAGGVKFFIDGVIEGYTGFLVEEYADRPGVFGACNYEIEHYNELVVEADRLGLQISTHAVGDMGVRTVLNAYERARQKNGTRDSRHRVEHIEVIHPDDLPRFKQLGVVASMQPMHAPLSGSDQDVWLKRVGERRWPLSFAWSTIRAAGATLTFGSDWPIATQDPLRGLHATLTRLPWKEGFRDHRQELAQALLSYTRDGAYAEFQDHHKGRLKAGYLADLVLLDHDLFETPPEQVREVKPSITMMDGSIVYEA